MPVDIQRFIYLCQNQCGTIPFECIGGIGSRLAVLFLLEGWVFGAPLKEMLEGFVQVPQGLLNRDRRDLSQPGVGFLEVRQHGSKIVVVEPLTALSIGNRAGMESPIVHEADTSKCLSKDDSLLISRVESVLVRPLSLAHCLFAFLLLLDILLNGIDDLAVSRSLILLSNFLESLKKRWVNVERKSLCLHTGSISLFYLCNNRQRLALVSKHHKGTALSSPHQ